MGPARLELATSSLSATRSSQLSYEPVIDRAASSSMSDTNSRSHASRRPRATQDPAVNQADKEKAANKTVSGSGGTDESPLGALGLTGFMLASWL